MTRQWTKSDYRIIKRTYGNDRVFYHVERRVSTNTSNWMEIQLCSTIEDAKKYIAGLIVVSEEIIQYDQA